MNKRVRQAVENAGVVPNFQEDGRALFEEQILVISQKTKLIEVNAEYSIFDKQGHQIGTAREIGQNLFKKALKVDTYGTRRMQIVDMNGQTLISLVAPATVIMSKVLVLNADGSEAGRVQQKFGILNARFALTVANQVIGSLSGEGWDSWNFNVQDADGREVARITKKWDGLAKAIFTNSDSYVLEIRGPVAQPLRTLIIAAALVVDTHLRQGQTQSQDRRTKASRGWADAGA